MSINVTLNSISIKNRTYPYLAIHPESKQVILFIKPKTGVTIDKGSNSFTCNGEYCEVWTEHSFSVFEGEVILKNEF